MANNRRRRLESNNVPVGAYSPWFLIAILALLPLALSAGGSLQTPLAIAIIAGLLAAVPLVLLFMPVVYWRLAGSTRS